MALSLSIFALILVETLSGWWRNILCFLNFKQTLIKFQVFSTFWVWDSADFWRFPHWKSSNSIVTSEWLLIYCISKSWGKLPSVSLVKENLYHHCTLSSTGEKDLSHYKVCTTQLASPPISYTKVSETQSSMFRSQRWFSLTPDLFMLGRQGRAHHRRLIGLQISDRKSVNHTTEMILWSMILPFLSLWLPQDQKVIHIQLPTQGRGLGVRKSWVKWQQFRLISPPLPPCPYGIPYGTNLNGNMGRRHLWFF